MKYAITLTLFMAAISVFPVKANAYETIGKVISVEQAPLMCSERRSNPTSSPFIMGVTGALTGNQFGKGNGKVANTVIGAAAGAYIGSNNKRHNEQRIDCKFDGYINTISYTDRYGREVQTTRQTAHALRVGSRLNIRTR